MPAVAPKFPYLKDLRRMQIEQIRPCRFAEQHPRAFFGFIGLAERGPKTADPGSAPASTTAAIGQAAFE
jgi:hypothetical protein